jgi:excinuclease ABC subunit C
VAYPSAKLIKFFKDKMAIYSKNNQFEKAADVRDTLIALEKINEKNTVIFSTSQNFDLFAFAADHETAVCEIFSVKKGRVDFEKWFNVEKQLDFSMEDLLEKTLLEFYQNNQLPKTVFVPFALSKSIKEILSKGGSTVFKVAVRGDKKKLYDTAIANAKQKLKTLQNQQISGVANISKILNTIKSDLSTYEYPLRIEMYDIAHFQGKHTVASMVVFEDGLPAKKEYRKFKLKVEQNNDTASIREVLTRRFSQKNLKNEKFAYAPSLVVIDGGKPQLTVAAKVFAELKIKNITLVAMAKRNRELFILGKKTPYQLTGSVLLFFERISNEAHRFAISYYRQEHLKGMIKS